MESALISFIGGILIRLVIPEPVLISFDRQPDFITQVPPGHYIGISKQHSELVEARDDALQDAIKQIFQVIGAEYTGYLLRRRLHRKTSRSTVLSMMSTGFILAAY